MPLHEVELDELGLWKPRSGFFQHEYRKKRAKLMVQTDPAAQHAKLAFCTYHNTPYLSGDDIPNSPCCNTEPLLTYDLEEMQLMSSVTAALVDALEASGPEQLIALIQGLAGLARANVAGYTGELSEAPSTAPTTDPNGGDDVEQPALPGASVDGSTEGGGDSLPPPLATPPPTPPARPKRNATRTPRARRSAPAAAAVAS